MIIGLFHIDIQLRASITIDNYLLSRVIDADLKIGDYGAANALRRRQPGVRATKSADRWWAN